MTRWVNAAGFLLVILSLAFVLDRLWSSAIWHMAGETLFTLPLLLIGCAALYALSGFLLATAWHGLVVGSKQLLRPLPWSQAVAIYGRTQLAKYIPGNVFHLVGRHAYGLRIGLGHAPQAIAAVAEMVFTILAAGTVSLLGWSLPLAETSQGRLLALWLVLAVIAILLVAKVLLSRSCQHQSSSWVFLQQAVHLSWRRLGQAYGLYLGFFLLSGAMLTLLLWVVSGLSFPAYTLQSWLSYFAVSSFAWLVGFITPGASAGIGVREAVLILLLGPQVGETHATVAAVGFRFITIAGDLGFFLCSLVFREKASSPLTNN